MSSEDPLGGWVKNERNFIAFLGTTESRKILVYFLASALDIGEEKPPETKACHSFMNAIPMHKQNMLFSKRY